MLPSFCKIDPSQPLHKHFIFWLPIAIFVLPALVLSLPTWCLCWPEPTEYESILKTQGLPAFIASLAIPFTVAVTRFHSSAQRAETNRLAEQNMTFNHYFDHRTHFFKHVESMELSEPYSHFVEVKDPDALYKIIFPLNKMDYQNMSAPKEEVEKVIFKKVDSVVRYVDKFIVDYFDGNDPFIDSKVIDFVARIGRPFGITIKPEVVYFVRVKNNRVDRTVLNLIFYSFLEVVQSAGKFSHKGFGGWTPALSLDPLFKSTQDSKEFNEFSEFLRESLLDGKDG